MKFKKWGQGILAAAVSVGLGFGLSSCGASNTIDYLYLLSAANSSTGEINAYRVDSQTGALTQIANSPYPTGDDPVGITIAPNGKTLYVINYLDNTIESFGIGTDAKLYAQHTYNTPGSEPVAIGINPAGTFLFVVDYYEPNYTTDNPGPGAIVVYPINSDGSLGSAVSQTISSTQSATYYPLGDSPSALSVLANGSYLYVTDLLTSDASGCNTGQGAVVAFSIGSSGALTQVTGSPYCAGSTPSAMASHPKSSYLYVTDSAQDEILGYTVQSDGTLVSFTGSPVATGTFPDGITVEPRGLYLYVANRTSGSVQSYSLGSGTGIPSSTGTYSTDTYPQCVIVEPALGRFVYTADYQGIGSSGFKLDPNTGLLSGTENSPYTGSGQATCLAATSHGNHTVS